MERHSSRGERPLHPIARTIRLGCRATALLVLAVGLVSARGATAGARDDVRVEALGPLAQASQTGVIYDRVLPLAHLERLDGSASAPEIDLATWRQAYDELRRAAWRGPEWPALDRLAADARADVRAGVIPIAWFDRAYERVRSGAL